MTNECVPVHVQMKHEANVPTGPFTMTDIALPSVHTNPQIMRTPNGEWLLYSQAVCASNQYDPVKGCVGCHKGMCGQ